MSLTVHDDRIVSSSGDTLATAEEIREWMAEAQTTSSGEAQQRDRLADLRRTRSMQPEGAQWGNEAKIAELDAEIADLEVEVRAESVRVEQAREAAAKAARETPAAIRAAALAELEAQRPTLAVRMLDGDEAARKELAQTDVQIGELSREAELEVLAAEERTRLAEEAAQAVIAEEAKQRAARLNEALGTRSTLLEEFLGSLGETRDRLRALVGADALVQGEQDTSVRSMIVPNMVEVTLAALVQAGVPRLMIPGMVLNARTAQLLEVYPLPPVRDFGADQPAVKIGRPCSVCLHASRIEIQSALAAGKGPTEVGRLYGLSKDAVARHRDHSKEATT